MNNSSYSIENSVELITFINKERYTKKINYKKVVRFFYKCLHKSIIEMNIKFKEIDNSNESLISGINMIYHIFFILIVYTNNIKLTIFLLERSILLYTEFIIMSQDKKVVEEIYFVPNINDAVSFSFKKTIGSIVLSNIDCCNQTTIFIREICICIRNICKLIKEHNFKFESSIDTQNNDNIDIINKKLLTKHNDIFDILKIKHKYYNDTIDIDNTYNQTDTKSDSLIKYILNIISNEIIESLLLININSDYENIFKKIDCILNSNNNISDKLGKIKLLLYIYNREYLFSDSKISKLKKNKLFIYIFNVVNTKNAIYKDILERFFDSLVYYDFSDSFSHNYQTNSECTKIKEEYIENHLNEIFNYIS